MIYGTIAEENFSGISPNAPELGGTVNDLNDTGSAKWLDAEYRGGRLWAARNVACDFGGGNSESCIDWIQVGVSGPSPVLEQQQVGGAYGGRRGQEQGNHKDAEQGGLDGAAAHEKDSGRQQVQQMGAVAVVDAEAVDAGIDSAVAAGHILQDAREFLWSLPRPPVKARRRTGDPPAPGARAPRSAPLTVTRRASAPSRSASHEPAQPSC